MYNFQIPHDRDGEFTFHILEDEVVILGLLNKKIDTKNYCAIYKDTLSIQAYMEITKKIKKSSNPVIDIYKHSYLINNGLVSTILTQVQTIP